MKADIKVTRTGVRPEVVITFEVPEDVKRGDKIDVVMATHHLTTLLEQAGYVLVAGTAVR